MIHDESQKELENTTDFEASGQQRRATLIEEVICFIFEYKKWWMIPIAVSMLLLGLIAVLSATGAAPFIYTLF